MSRKVVVSFQVNSMAIMKDTLTEMGINYKCNENCITTYNGVSIKDGEIVFDSDQNRIVNSIKQNYMVNFYKDKAIREGKQFRQELSTNGDVIIQIL